MQDIKPEHCITTNLTRLFHWRWIHISQKIIKESSHNYINTVNPLPNCVQSVFIIRMFYCRWSICRHTSWTTRPTRGWTSCSSTECRRSEVRPSWNFLGDYRLGIDLVRHICNRWTDYIIRMINLYLERKFMFQHTTFRLLGRRLVNLIDCVLKWEKRWLYLFIYLRIINSLNIV